MSFFDETGCMLLGNKTADELAPLKLNEADSSAFDSYVNSVAFASEPKPYPNPHPKPDPNPEVVSLSLSLAASRSPSRATT